MLEFFCLAWKKVKDLREYWNVGVDLFFNVCLFCFITFFGEGGYGIELID